MQCEKKSEKINFPNRHSIMRSATKLDNESAKEGRKILTALYACMSRSSVDLSASFNKILHRQVEFIVKVQMGGPGAGKALVRYISFMVQSLSLVEIGPFFGENIFFQY